MKEFTNAEVSNLKKDIFGPTLEKIKALKAKGVFEINLKLEYDVFKEAKYLKQLVYHRGRIQGMLTVARALKAGEWLVGTLEPQYLSLEQNALALTRMKDEMVTEIRHLIFQIPVPFIVQSLDAILQGLKHGVDVNNILSKEGEDYVWLNQAAELVHLYGFYQGAAYAIDLIARGQTQLAGELMNEYYSLSDTTEDSEQ